MKLARFILLAGLALFAASCKVGPNYTTPTAKVARHWEESAAVTNQAYSAAEEYWWRNFHDLVLDQLVESAFKNNLSLQVAGVRILEARAKLNKSIGNLFPQQQTLSGQVNYTRLNDGIVTAIPGIDRNYLSDQVLLAATWEIDFWGK
jgi:outer membrane protein TolC